MKQVVRNLSEVMKRCRCEVVFCLTLFRISVCLALDQDSFNDRVIP